MLVSEIPQMLLDVAEEGALPAICDSSFSSFCTTMAVKRSIKFTTRSISETACCKVLSGSA